MRKNNAFEKILKAIGGMERLDQVQEVLILPDWPSEPLHVCLSDALATGTNRSIEFRHIAVEPDGRTVSDPLMSFEVIESEGETRLQPTSYFQEFTGYYSAALSRDGDAIRENRVVRRDLEEFCRAWVNNLDALGFVELARKQDFLEGPFADIDALVRAKRREGANES